MRIAQIPPLFETVPPKFYGGTERVVAHLCDALVELGHDVTLFAAADARTRARLCVVRDQAIRLDHAALKSELASHLSMLHEVRRRAASFDVLHFHTDMLQFPMFESYARKCLTTLHGRLDIKDLSRAYERWPEYGLVSISDAQRRPLPNAHWLATVPHGVPPAQYAFADSPGGYLAFLGRISPEKGPADAIRLAIRAGLPLKIAAKVDQVDRGYFETLVKPLLGHPLIEFVGEIGDAQKAEFLGQARALLFPIAWPEPFGLVMIEAMACGTPVIAYDCGSVREVIAPGRSGFIVSSEEQALAAIARIGELPRRAVRADFEQRFTAQTMAEAYLEVYGMMHAPRQAVARIAASM
jgi:glycosyltransferase involved in cell wall biosynthesis